MSRKKEYIVYDEDDLPVFVSDKRQVAGYIGCSVKGLTINTHKIVSDENHEHLFFNRYKIYEIKEEEE